MAEFKITCFVKQEPNALFPLLLPLQFTWSINNTLEWKRDGQQMSIVPFANMGREQKGYRILSNMRPDGIQYLFDQTFGGFSPTISGVECTLYTTKGQGELIKEAEKAGFTRCSQYGLYEHKGVGVVIFPDGVINLQIRNRKIRVIDLSRFLQEIDDVAATFKPKPVDLFYYLNDEVMTG